MIIPHIAPFDYRKEVKIMYNEGNLAKKLDAAKHHVLFHHNPDNTDGYITIAKKDRKTGRFVQMFYQPADLAHHLTHVLGEDVFFSQNTFYRKARRIETVRQLRSLYVDLDCYLFNYTPNQILMWLEADFFRNTIPEPNMIIFSGQGIVLIWKIEPAPYMALPLWQAIQNYLIDKLRPLGGDPRAADAARIFRLAGSISSKNGNEVKVQYRHDYEYTLREIQDEYLPDLKPQTEKSRPGRKKKILHLFNVYTLHGARLQDLDRLVNLRHGDMSGHRETTLFLYRYWSCCFEQDPETAIQHTLEFNRMFTHPLSEREVLRATRSAEKAYHAKSNKEANERAQAMGYPGAGYRISNAKLISWLDITREEQKHLRTIIGVPEKNRRRREARRAAGMMSREEYLKKEAQKTISKQELIKRELEKNPQISIRKLAEKTGMSKSAIQRLKAKL